jgi:hypothetical protein
MKSGVGNSKQSWNSVEKINGVLRAEAMRYAVAGVREENALKRVLMRRADRSPVVH